MTDPVFQDWEKVVFKKHSKEKTDQDKNAQLKQQYNSHIRKVENEDYVPDKPKFELRQFLQKGKTRKKIITKRTSKKNISSTKSSSTVGIRKDCDSSTAISQINRALKVNMKKQEILN